MATITGTGVDETLFGTGGDDTIRGLGGNDLLIGKTGADRLEGGLGRDTASYRTAGPGLGVDLVNPELNAAGGVGDTYASIENLEGGRYDDYLAGDAFANRISGGKGGDNLLGRGGDDILRGESGNDVLDGGGFVEGDDLLYGGSGNDYMVGYYGADTLEGGKGKDGMNAGEDADVYLYSDLTDSTVNKPDRIDFTVEDKVDLRALELGSLDTVSAVYDAEDNLTDFLIDHGQDGSVDARIIAFGDCRALLTADYILI